MRRWCRLAGHRTVMPGNYSETKLITLSKRPLHQEKLFLDELAERVMQRYEGRTNIRTLVIPQQVLKTPNRTKRFYHLLFDTDGNCTQDFLTEASETLALWLEQSMDSVIYAEAGLPHNSDPAYDVLSIIHDATRTPRLRVIQVKATENRLQKNCNEALAKFRRLEEGHYDAQLNARLELLADRKSVPETLDVGELMYELRYRVVAVHSEDRDEIQILTTYEKSIAGEIERRSARLIQIDWPGFWEQLARRVYDQLN